MPRKKRITFPGSGGLVADEGCYGSPTFCDWQMVGGADTIPGLTRQRIDVLPVVAPHVNVRYVYMFGTMANSPSTNARFTIGTITVGGEAVLAIDNPFPTATGQVILSDVFNRSHQPIFTNWAIISTAAWGSPLSFDLFNINAAPINVYIALYGIAMDTEFVKRWKAWEAGNGNNPFKELDFVMDQDLL